MSRSRPKLDALSIVLPRGTRVVLRATIEGQRGPVSKGTSAVTVQSNGRRYIVKTLGGEELDVGRDQIEPQAAAVLERLGTAQEAFDRLRPGVVLAVVVGSRAWNLANAHSDSDVRGAFVLPFDEANSLFAAPDEIHDPSQDESFWEIEKLIRQGMRADPNTLETLWSPLVRECTGIGQRLVDERDLFTSRLVIGSFGRYAQGQAKKLEGALVRERALHMVLDHLEGGGPADRNTLEALVASVASDGKQAITLADLLRSVRDRAGIATAEISAVVEALNSNGADGLRPPPVRPKNAYNLLRLLHSCLHWIAHHVPMIGTEGSIRTELLEVKNGEWTMAQVLARAETLGREIEAKANETTLPEVPNQKAADAILLEARRQSARTAIGVGPPASVATNPSALNRNVCGQSLPEDVDTAAVRAFFSAYDAGGERALPLMHVALTGAHAYGFPSPDSDLDLKAIHAVAAEDAIARRPNFAPVETIEIYRGREFDFSSHEIGQVVGLLERGNGNMLERLLGPYAVVTTPLGDELVSLAQDGLSKSVVGHYRGFFGGSVREYERSDAGADSDAEGRSVKRLLYAYRVALTGAFLLDTGTMETDLRPLAEHYGFSNVSRLIKRKSEAENARLLSSEQRGIDADLERLRSTLNDALSRSTLPDAPKNMAALDAFVVRARKLSDGWESTRLEVPGAASESAQKGAP